MCFVQWNYGNSRLCDFYFGLNIAFVKKLDFSGLLRIAFDYVLKRPSRDFSRYFNLQISGNVRPLPGFYEFSELPSQMNANSMMINAYISPAPKTRGRGSSVGRARDSW